MTGKLFAILLLLLAGFTPCAEALQLSEAEFLLDNATTPPPADAAWQKQSLPDFWRNSRPAAASGGWYRFHFRLVPDGNAVQAVFLPRLGLNAEVWLNGRRLGSGGRMEEPLSRNWNRPLLFPIPHNILKAEGNTLHIRLAANPYTQASLFPPFIGPETELRQAHDRSIFFNVSLNQTASILIAAIGLLMLSLWWRRQQEIAYGYFGVSALVWAIQSINLYVRDTPFATAQWEVLTNASFQIFSALLLASLLRFTGLWKERYRPWFVALLAGSPITLLLVPAAYFFHATSFWHLATLVATLFTLALTLRAALIGNREARLLVAALGLIVLFALHDWLLHSAHLWRMNNDISPEQDFMLLQYSAPLLFLALGWIMTSRYLRTLNEFEQLSNELDLRVKAKQAELEQSYARMKQLEMEQAVAAERERIHSDLHDDVGAKLLSLVYRADNDENAELARSALQDLRDVVSHSGDSIGLEEIAADWRAECKQRLGEAGIDFAWLDSGNFSGLVLSQPQALNLTRIVREAVSNIIRHSAAGRASMRLAYDAGRLEFEIADDGRGCPEQPPPGRGLRGMNGRAQRLGATFTRHAPAGGGTAIRLELPLGKALPPRRPAMA